MLLLPIDFLLPQWKKSYWGIVFISLCIINGGRGALYAQDTQQVNQVNTVPSVVPADGSVQIHDKILLKSTSPFPVPELEVPLQPLPLQALQEPLLSQPLQLVQPSPPASAEESQVAKPDAKIDEKKPKDPDATAPAHDISDEINDISAQEIKGISTIALDDPRGNWLFKRVWWEHAQDKIEKIRLRSDDVYESRIKFFEKRIYVEKKIIDPFYIAMGLSQGQLKEIITEILRYLEQVTVDQAKTSTQDSSLSDVMSVHKIEPIQSISDNKTFLAIVKQEQANIEMLQKYSEGIAQLDADTDAVINKLIDLINTVRRYEQEAWSLFKEISGVLSDIAARDLFLRMSTISRNIQAIHSYIYGPLSQHFDILIQNIEQYAADSKKSVDMLKEKGIDLKAYADKVSQDAIKTASVAEVEEEKEELDDARTGVDSFWKRTWRTIQSAVQTVWAGIVAVVTWPFSRMPSEEQKDDENQEKNNEDLDNQKKDQ